MNIYIARDLADHILTSHLVVFRNIIKCYGRNRPSNFPYYPCSISESDQLKIIVNIHLMSNHVLPKYINFIFQLFRYDPILAFTLEYYDIYQKVPPLWISYKYPKEYAKAKSYLGMK